MEGTPTHSNDARLCIEPGLHTPVDNFAITDSRDIYEGSGYCNCEGGKAPDKHLLCSSPYAVASIYPKAVATVSYSSFWS
jgi:hypothetical protein